MAIGISFAVFFLLSIEMKKASSFLWQICGICVIYFIL